MFYKNSDTHVTFGTPIPIWISFKNGHHHGPRVPFLVSWSPLPLLQYCDIISMHYFVPMDLIRESSAHFLIQNEIFWPQATKSATIWWLVTKHLYELTCIKNGVNWDKIKLALTLVWLEHPTFWSGDRHTTIAL